MQTLMALLIVAACTAYAMWTLMPQAWRGALQRRLTGRAPAPASGCGSCGACAGKPAAVDSPSVISLHRRTLVSTKPPGAD